MKEPALVPQLRFALFVVLCSALLFSCDRDGHTPRHTQKDTTRVEPRDTSQSLRKGFALQLFAATTEFPAVCYSELKCVRDSFPKHFMAGAPGDETELRGRMRSLSLSALMGLVEKRMEDHDLDAQNIGVKFHYGLKKSGTSPDFAYDLLVAVEIKRLRPRGSGGMYFDVLDLENSVQMVNDEGGLDAGVSRNTWTTGRGKDYFDNVLVRRNRTGNMERVVRGSDHEAYLFKWEDLFDLQEQNEATHLNIQAIAGPEIRIPGFEDDWHHDLAISAAKELNGTDLVDDEDPDGFPFRGRALDLGSPCPPSCVLAKFYRYGLAPNDGCECPH